MMQRFDDWEAQLREWAEMAQERGFVWGEWDCAMLAASAVEAQTGHDIAATWRGRYDTRVGSARALLSRGCDCLADAMSEQMGAPRPPLLAGRGDIVQSAAGALGVVLADRALTVVEDGGPDWIVRADWARVWKVARDG